MYSSSGFEISRFSKQTLPKSWPGSMYDVVWILYEFLVYIRHFILILSSSFFQAIFLYSLADYKGFELDGFEYPAWGNALGWMMVLSSCLCIPIVAVYEVSKREGSIWQVGLSFPISCRGGSRGGSGSWPLSSKRRRFFLSKSVYFYPSAKRGVLSS